LGLAPPRGILLHGPPGCAKTTLARAAAGAAGVAFLSLSPADVYASSYVGEAESVVRRAFSLARSASPCILFFDEIDSIVAASGSNKSGMDRGNSAEGKFNVSFLSSLKIPRKSQYSNQIYSHLFITSPSSEHIPQRDGWSRRLY